MKKVFRYGNPEDDRVLDERMRRGRPVLEDGETLRIPVHLQDSAQEEFRHKQRASRQATDASGSRDFHRAGFRVASAYTDSDAVQQARAEYLDYVQNAYKLGDARGDDPDTGFGSNGSLDLQVGAACTVKQGGGRFGPEGARGTIQRVDGRLVCVANSNNDAMSRDGLSHAQIMDREYRRYEEEQSRAWRAGQ